jgi:hypothetical protein
MAYIVDRSMLGGVPSWRHAGSGSRHDHRFFELVDDTIRQDFEYSYLVLKGPRGDLQGIQPVFVHPQDLLGGLGGPLSSAVAWLRKKAPGVLKLRTLMVGSPVGEGVLGAAGEDPSCFARALADALLPAAQRLRTPLIVLKEFPAEYRPAFRVFLERGYTRIPSMPYAALDLNFEDFEEHMRRSLSSSVRKDLRRKFRDAAAASPLSMHVTNDISDSVDELYPLYLQVYERSSLRFERLTPEYLVRLGRDLPDRTRFFVWTQGRRPVAFNVCTLHDGVLWAEYLGLDYRCALDLHLYFVVMRDEINWCCRNGVRRYCSTSLNYDPKLHLRFRLLPLDLYVRHVNGCVNRILGRVVPWLTPANRDATLRLFPNSADL